MDADEYLKYGKVSVWPERYAVAKTKKLIPDAFATIRDRGEITTIIEQSKLKDILEVNRAWRLLTFDMVLPIELIGFIAKVSSALAEEGISILNISAYSTDHILVLEKDLDKTLRKLEDLGCSIDVKNE